MIEIVILLIVFIVIIAVLTNYGNKKHSPWYSYLSYNDNLTNNVLDKFLIDYFLNRLFAFLFL